MIKTGDPNIFIASTYRSGCLHLAHRLAQSTGFRMAATNGFHGEGEEEQNVNPFMAAILFPYGRQVFVQHVKGTSGNWNLISSFNNSVIVLTRNIYDSLLSLHKWILDPNPKVIPGLVIPRSFRKWAEEDRWCWLGYHAAPWYLEFTCSWIAHSDYQRLTWIDYDEYFLDEKANLNDLLRRMGRPGDTQIDLQPLDHYKVIGESGRGKEGVPEFVKRQIQNEIEAWGPHADFIRKKLL